MTRKLRLLVLAGCISVMASLPGAASAAVAWGPQRTVADWSWSSGASLARTGDGASTVAHQLFSTDNIDGSFATDHGPYEGVFLTSSDDRGQSWSSPQRVSQATRHADRGALGASGTTLYAAWVVQASYDRYDPAAHRVLYFRADPGATPAGWGPTVRLSKQKGRVDAPALAASGKSAYVAWTDANTGELRVASTKDRGKTWNRDVLGRARANDPGGEGHVGLPAIGAAGGNVGVAWLATSDGAVRARISKNAGRTWGPTITLLPSGGAANGGSPGVAGSGNRLVFSWTTAAGVWVRTWTAGTWSAAVRVEAFGGASPHSGGYDAQPSIADGGTVGLVWSGCRSSSCNLLSGLARVELLFAQSADGGLTWSAPSSVRASANGDQPVNDGGSVLWWDASTRIVTYGSSVPGFTTYRLYARVGNGNS